MSLQVEKLEKNMAKLTIEASAEEFEAAVEKAYQKEKYLSSRIPQGQSTAKNDRENVWYRCFL